MSSFGAQDMISPLRRVMVKRPGEAMAAANPQSWHYATPLSLEKIRVDHDDLVGKLAAAGAEVLELEDDPRELADLVFTHDPSLVTSAGAIVLRMGKLKRRGEETLHARFYESIDVPILGTIEEPGTVEAGDCVWIDEKTLAVGMGFRTNEAGVDQLRGLLEPLGVAVESFDLPMYQGSDACLHLMSIMSMLDHDLALIYAPMVPVRLAKLLEVRGVTTLAADEAEFTHSGTLSLNVLALAPRKCLAVAGNDRTAELMRAAGVDLETFRGDELCLKAEGGPTCLTRPIWRG
ncbi:MAG: amidinotransferase [Planctomycetota bacterium]|nr:MAG: amidinotransferase [Planctomycetota bacterium]REJ91583.1 MAG: amidinotransferase [Planctomycetota bacterium]